MTMNLSNNPIYFSEINNYSNPTEILSLTKLELKKNELIWIYNFICYFKDKRNYSEINNSIILKNIISEDYLREYEGILNNINIERDMDLNLLLSNVRKETFITDIFFPQNDRKKNAFNKFEYNNYFYLYMQILYNIKNEDYNVNNKNCLDILYFVNLHFNYINRYFSKEEKYNIIKKLFNTFKKNITDYLKPDSPYKDVIFYEKYSNNYDYNKAVFLMSNFNLLDNEFLTLKEDTSYASPISSVFYEYFEG
jgi:hypothetical protein